jgi:dTDP-4-dehydrorhamnose 3,5-epimerase
MGTTYDNSWSFPMQVESLAIPGLLLLTPQVFADERGFFFESWNAPRFAQLLAADASQVSTDLQFVQDNHSRSARGVLRGLHYQLPPHPQGKLVRCSAGEIFDVVVDLRRSSATFGRWVGLRLNAAHHQQLWVPPGFAHGFLSLEDGSEVLYKTTDVWYRECERCLRWDDPSLAIAWPLEELGAASALNLSDKDAVAPGLAELEGAGELFP